MSRTTRVRGVARTATVMGCCVLAAVLIGLSASAAPGLGPISFGAHSGYSGGTAPARIAVFDANRDGTPDVVQTSDASGSLGIDFLANNGTGGLQSAVYSTSGLRTTSITHADFNGDGNEDVAVCGPYASTVAVRYGDGHGNFSSGWTGTTAASPTCVVAGDWNKDGAADLAVADSAGVKVFLHSGSSFAAPVSVAVSVVPLRLATGDFDRDGDVDLLVGGASSVVVLGNNGSGAFSEGNKFGIGATVAALTARDFDGDGVLDFAVADSGGGLAIWKGNGAGSFASVATASASGTPYEIAAADLDLDGDLDLAATMRDTNRVELFANDGLGGLSTAGHVSVGNSPEGLAFARMNRDGMPDIVVANTAHGSVGVALNTTPRLHGVGFTDSVHFNTPADPWAATTDDFNRDGHPDIATVERFSNQLEVLLGDGAGSLTVTATIPVGDSPRAVACGDINRDGIPDLVVSTGNIFLGDGDGDFTAQPPVSVGNSSVDVALGDFNGDGKLDLCTANNGGGNVTVRFGDGSGGFPSRIDTGSLVTPQAVRLADFNRDGKLDIATVNSGDNSVAVLLGNGSGSFTQTSTAVPNANTADTFGVGDFNEDGVPDLAVADWHGHVSLLTGTGTGTFSGSAVVSAGSATGDRSLAVADVDNDGHDDIVVTVGAWEDGGYVLLGDGTGGLGTPQRVSELMTLCPVLVDLNHDGRLDLVDCSCYGGRVNVVLGDTFPPVTTLNHSPSSPNGPDGWYTGQFNRPDFWMTTAETATHYYQYDATATSGWQVAPDTGFYMADEGTHTLYYYSQDPLGNTEAVRGEVFKWDGSPPTGSFAINGGAAYTDTHTVSIDSSMSDAVEMCFSTDGAHTWTVWEPYAAHRTLVLQPSGEGGRLVYAQYRDNHGLVLSWDVLGPQEIGVDQGPPGCLAHKTPADDWSNAATVSVDIYATDISGIRSRNYKIDGGVTETYTVPFEFTSEGSHTISYWACDNAGNACATKDITVRIDRTKPTSATLSSATNPTSSLGWGDYSYGVVDLVGQSDAGSGVKGYSVTVTTGTAGVPDEVVDYPAVSTNIPVPLYTEPEGVPWYVGVRVVDYAGNVSDPVIYGPIAYETVRPTVSCDLDSVWRNQPVTATVSIEDTTSGPAHVTYGLDSVSHDYAGPVGISVEGMHWFEFWGYDRAGNATHGGTAVNLDFTPPEAATVVSSSHHVDVWSGNPLVVTGATCSDIPGAGPASGIAGYSYAWAHSPLPTVDTTIDVLTQQTETVLADGPWYVGVRGVDVAGNAGSPGYFGPILIDTTPPMTTVVPGSAWRKGPVDVALAPTDAGSGVAHTFLSVAGADAEETTTAHIADEGTTTVAFHSEDNLGHVETTHTAAIRIDNTAPSVACRAAATYTDTAVLAISAADPLSGVASVSYRLDGGATQTVVGTGASVSSSAWGSHTLRYVATDAAGNVSAERTASFTIVPSVVTPHTVRSPSGSSVTYKRKKGVARYTLKVTATRPGGVGIGGLRVYLQTSKNGKSGWKNSYRLLTNSSGVVSKAFSAKKKATLYYRWYLTASYQSRAAYTGKQTVVIK